MSEKTIYDVFNTNISKLEEDSFQMLFSMMGFTNSKLVVFSLGYLELFRES